MTQTGLGDTDGGVGSEGTVLAVDTEAKALSRNSADACEGLARVFVCCYGSLQGFARTAVYRFHFSN